MKPKNHNIAKIFVDTIEDKNLRNFMNEHVLVELPNKDYTGVLGLFKQKYVLFENDIVKISFKPEDVLKISGKNKKTNLFETITRCGANKFCVKSKKGKNLGGPYSSMAKAKDRIREVEYFKHVKEDLLLQERLKGMFFSEEIVNPDHKGRMSKSMQASRDKTASKLKNVKVVKGPPGRDDTPEEAKYRLATYIEWKKKNGN